MTIEAITTPQGEAEDVHIVFKAQSVIEDRRLVFGWAYVCEDVNGSQVVDHSEQIIEPLELEDAVYVFVRCGGMASENHTDMYAGSIVESVVFTKEKQAALGLPVGSLPVGWWVGLFIYSQEVFDKVKSGEYKMLSLGGRAVKEEVT